MFQQNYDNEISSKLVMIEYIFLNSTFEGNSLTSSGNAFQALAPMVNILFMTVVLSEKGTTAVHEQSNSTK